MQFPSTFSRVYKRDKRFWALWQNKVQRVSEDVVLIMWNEISSPNTGHKIRKKESLETIFEFMSESGGLKSDWQFSKFGNSLHLARLQNLLFSPYVQSSNAFFYYFVILPGCSEPMNLVPIANCHFSTQGTKFIRKVCFRAPHKTESKYPMKVNNRQKVSYTKHNWS